MGSTLPGKCIHFLKFAGMDKVGYGYIKRGIKLKSLCNLCVLNFNIFISAYRLAEHSMDSAHTHGG